MLHRKSRHRQCRPLGRSKSAHSIIGNPVDKLESIDPAIARRDAHIAATLSYQRAHGGPITMAQSSARIEDNAVPGAMSRRRLNATNGFPPMEETSFETSLAGPTCDLQRQHSIRFSGPKARLKRSLAPRASRNRTSSIGNKDHAAPAGQTLKGIAEVHGKAFGFHSLTRNYLRSLKAAEIDGRGGARISTPESAQRKLRKSRSMFTALAADEKEHGSSKDVPDQPSRLHRSRSRYAALNSHGDTSKSRWASEPAPNSFAETGSTILRPLSQPSKELALQLAREKFQQEVEQQHQHPLQLQPSLFLRSQNKRSESSMALRKSLRNSSNTSGALSSAFSGQSLALPRQSGLRKTARRVSQSLRSRVKGLFLRPRMGDGYSSLQDRKEQASHDGAESAFDEDITLAGEASMSCVVSHIPSLHAVPSYQHIQSRKGSVESLDGQSDHLADDKSRVTSWTNSLTNTLPSQSAAGEWERQRLSIIKENGTHVSSSSLLRPCEEISPAEGVDSDRVYAALMRRLEGSQGQAGEHQKQGADDAETHGVVPSPNTVSQPRNYPTIRCVKSEDDVFSDDCKSLEPRTDGASLLRPGAQGDEPAAQAQQHSSPGKEAQNSPRSFRSKTISNRSSVFFGSPSTHLFRTTSPYRRALQQEIHKPASAEVKTQAETYYPSVISPITLPVRRPSTIGSENWQTKASEGSQYSVRGDETTDNPWRTGDTIIDHFPRPPSAANSPAYQPRRNISTVSSVEWKNLLSSDVANHEDSTRASIGLGHVREQAEIDSPDERLNTNTSRREPSKQSTPLRAIQANSRSSSALKVPPQNPWEHAAQKAENERPSLQASNTCAAQKTPPVPTRVASRALPVRSYTDEAPRRDVLQQQGTIDCWPLLMPAKYVNHCEPSKKPKQHQRSRLDNVMTLSPQSWSVSQPQKEIRGPVPASPEHCHHSRLDKTLQRLHIRDSIGRSEKSDDEDPASETDTRTTGSKRMVDLFLSSRRRKVHDTRSRSTGHSSPAFL